MSPGRNMRKDELDAKQKRERANIVKDYQKSRMEDISNTNSEIRKKE